MLYLLVRVIAVLGKAPRVGIKPWFYANPLGYDKHYQKNGRTASSPLVLAAGDPSMRVSDVHVPCCKGCRYGDYQCASSCSYDVSKCRNNPHVFAMDMPATNPTLDELEKDQCYRHSDVSYRSGCAKLCDTMGYYMRKHDVQPITEDLLEGQHSESGHHSPEDAKGGAFHQDRLHEGVASSHDHFLSNHRVPTDGAEMQSMFRNIALSQSKKCSKKCKYHLKDECHFSACSCQRQLDYLPQEVRRQIWQEVKLVYTFADYPAPGTELGSYDLCFAFGLSECVGMAWPKGNWMIY